MVSNTDSVADQLATPGKDPQSGIRAGTVPSAGTSPVQVPAPYAYDPPSPFSGGMVASISAPVSGGRPYGLLNAAAGPSSGYGVLNPGFGIERPDSPVSPSSAPPTPFVTGTTHPSEYIHTHHPRRGSMTPLGLNIISPKPPNQIPYAGPTPTQAWQPSFSPQRSVGFNPVQYAEGSSPTSSYIRRGSAASTTSTLTQSRPANYSAVPPGFNRERRRSSLTPSNPTLAPPSPSRHMATGRNSRPSSSDGPGSRSGMLHSRNRTEPPSRSVGPAAAGRDLEGVSAEEFGRRGSLPHILSSGWSGSAARTWNPSLPPQRGSVGEEILPDEGFKFGGGPPIEPHSPASIALRAIDPTAGSPRATGRGDVFAQAEADEAERQRRAFLAATYGVDGKRARERLSIGGNGSAKGDGAVSPSGSPGAALRRPSLMLWEKLGAVAAQRAAEAMELGSASAPTLPLVSALDPVEALGLRRGSLPVAIPGAGLGRSPSKREKREARENDMDAPLIIKSDPVSSDEEDDEAEEEGASQSVYKTDTLAIPIRPLPPLLPLSDPGPRLLPSTLALHRASHLLNARNLQPEPLPHPLPPSLHPPAPVDVTEFDIDFILAGSRAQLGGDKKNKNAPVDALRALDASAVATPTLKLGPGGEDEDTFAKFVGEFDDEYGDRRGEWTFRSIAATSPAADDARDPLDSAPLRPAVRAEWESHGAGRYELLGNGEVRSVNSGSVWRVRKAGLREYEIEEIKKGLNSKPVSPVGAIPTIVTIGTSFNLVPKSVHNEFGGVKFQYANFKSRQQGIAGRSNSAIIPPPARPAQLRASISEVSHSHRTARINSEDSVASVNFGGASLPLTSAINAMMPRRKRQGSRDATAELAVEETRGRPSVSFGRTPDDPEKGDKSKKAAERSLSKDRSRDKDKDRDRDDDKDKRKSHGIGGVFKRGIIASIKHSHTAHEEKKAIREERERERMQSQSWSGSVSSHKDHASWMHPTGKSSGTYYSQPGPHRKGSAGGGGGLGHGTRAGNGNGNGNGGSGTYSGSHTPSVHSSAGDERERERFPGVQDDPSSNSDREHAIADEDQSQSHPHAAPQEGKGWNLVPDDAVAMVIPIESDGPNGPSSIASHHSSPSLGGGPSVGGTSAGQHHPHRQALVVWYVPFNSEKDRLLERPSSSAAASTSSKEVTIAPDQPVGHGHGHGHGHSHSGSSSGMPKFQKLLRRRASKEHDLRSSSSSSAAAQAAAAAAAAQARAAALSNSFPASPTDQAGARVHPLPFRSFRVVARVADWDDLRSDIPASLAGSSTAFDHWAAQQSQSQSHGQGQGQGHSQILDRPTTTSPSAITTRTSYTSGTSESRSTQPAETHSHTSTSTEDVDTTSSLSTAPTSTIMAGRTFPTVIAVCHSRSQGVEFVLEGLDRLGFCQGESAWGPTGYEEWRGTGLSEQGRELLDLLWAGCVAVLGI